MNYEQTLHWMMSQLPMYQRVGRPAFKPDLSKSWDLMRLLGDPHQRFPSVHIAGTNGKGSTAHYLASILMESGFKTGLYTSPHLKDYRERIRINGKLIEKDYIKDLVNNHRQEFESLGLSFFEMTVGLAFKYFADSKVDIAVVEVGMGGRLDSTNVITPELSVITNIGLDHTYFLGETLPEIAGEKAGIIKEEIPVIVGKMQAATSSVFNQKAGDKSSSIYYADQHFSLTPPASRQVGEYYDKLEKGDKEYLSGIFNPLAGAYQSQNIITAVAAADKLMAKWDISPDAIVSGIRNIVKNTDLRGRWQVMDTTPLTIADTGHNSDGIRILVRQIKLLHKKKIHFVLSTVNDKNLLDILHLLPKEAIYYFCKADIPRGLPVEELKQQAEKAGLRGAGYSSVRLAYESARKAAGIDDLVFVGGSTFTVAEVL